MLRHGGLLLAHPAPLQGRAPPRLPARQKGGRRGNYQPRVPFAPLKGPETWDVIQPP